MFILPYKMGQVAVVLIFVVIFAMCSESLAPYRKSWDAWVSRIGHVVVFLSIFVAFLVLYVDDDEGANASEKVYGNALVATNICWIAAVVIEGFTTACSDSSVVENLPWSTSSSAVVGFSDDIYAGPNEDFAATERVRGAFGEDSNQVGERPRFRPSKQLPMPTRKHMAHEDIKFCL